MLRSTSPSPIPSLPREIWNGEPLRSAPAGGENPAEFSSLWGFIPFWLRDQRGQAEHPLMAECPCGGRKPYGFSSHCESVPDSGRESAVGRQSTPLWRSAPAGGENPTGFHSLVNPIPDSCRESAGAGRTPPYGGCASPSGAQCRHKGVLCLPGTMPDWGEDE
jgi:hypothetical protein